MKRVLALLLAAVMLLALGACAKTPAEDPDTNPGSTTDPGTTEPEKTELDIVTIPKLKGIAWFDQMIPGGEEWVAKNGGTFYQGGSATPDSALQLQALEDAITQKVDVIHIVPLATEPLEITMKKAMDQGIVVISHEAPSAENVHYDVEAFQNAAYGEHLMQALAKEMGEEGEYAIILGSIQAQTHKEWSDAAVAYQKEHYPNMKLVADYVESNENQDTAKTKTQELMKTYPNLKGIIGCSVIDPAGAALAVEEAGKSGEIKIVGTSVTETSGKFLESGTIQMISLWDTKQTSYAMCEVAKIVKEGGTVKTGDNLGAEGYESVVVDGKVIYGTAWLDFTAENMNDDPYITK
ncbi:substrate-binding domain-containing protein [Feifania hominis]|uniref:Substrate-binding domain-containing protein n=1 Tax=Feifania hominis TaxID=2763660 RepID=A0A926DE15_9FIRM|nr:substrate-binding domain-containing protein [Feifania hominis]MBC8536122.1 substrate-binding domain-containing protein [Feifania hominis]